MLDNPETIAHCEACNSPMDVTAAPPFSNVECPTCGQHSRVKLNFGPYTLIRRHAIGGMSMVFGAHDSTLNREVAVKILSEEYSQDETRIQAFEEEARITASFSHPNVVRVLRTGRAFGRFYIAMELVPGGHFEHHIRERGRIPEAELLPLAIEVAQGLKAAKAAGLIHRDVKPGNILLDSDGHAKLVDFGLSLVTQGGKATATELWATPFYVPPETVEGKEEDFRSDIYALGSTLYHALAGTPPCNEDSMATHLLLKAKQEIIPLKKAAPNISDLTCAIIHHSMAYNPDDRFSSYDELIHALRESVKELRKSPAVKKVAPKPQKTPWVPITAAALIAAAFIILWPNRDADPNAGGTSGTSPGNKKPINPTTPANAEDIARDFRKARAALKAGEFEVAANLFAQLHVNKEVQEPTRSWAGIEAVICHYLRGDTLAAAKQALIAQQHLEQGSNSSAQIDSQIKTILSQTNSLAPIECNRPSESPSQTVIAAMIAGLKNWQQGMLDPAAKCFKLAASTNLGANDQWVSIYQAYATDYLADHHILSGPLFNMLPSNARDCEKTLEELNLTVSSLKTQGRARYNVRAWQLDLARQAKALNSGSK